MRTVWILLLTALLGFAAPVSQAAQRDVMLVLDNSGSMRVNDPARLSVSAVTEFIRAQEAGTRVGIVTFADSPVLLKPLTPVSFETRDQLLGSLDALDFSGQWTDTASAVERALYELRVNGREDARQAIVLVTDGIIDTGNMQRDIENGSWLREMLASDARRNDVRIFGIAFTENADYRMLQNLASATNGEYFRALRAQDLGQVLERIDQVLDRNEAMQSDTGSAQTDFLTRRSQQTQQPVQREPQEEEENSPGSAAEPDKAATLEPERIRLETLASVETGATQPNPDAGASSPAEEGSFDRWRIFLIILGLVAIGAVAASILWSEELARFLRGVRRPAAEPDHGPGAVLYDVYDPSDIKRHEIGNKPVVIGRVSGSDPAMDYVVVDERTVGRWHATIERRGQSFWIRDEGSVNGTFVNDQRVTSEHPLKHGDMVRVHRHEFEFVIPELFDSDRTMIAGNGGKARNTGAMSTG